jgi:hypothetical protein
MMKNPPVSRKFRQHRQFLDWARGLVRLPEPGEGPLDYLLPEARWQELLRAVPDPAAWLMALSQATGLYFFPSREWPPRLVRFLKLLKITRLLEAGAGRGYLTAALAPLCRRAGLDFRAVDKGEGEFQSGLPVYAGVERGEVGAAGQDFRPQAVLYAWPPPGQSLARICQAPFLHYLLVVGESGGGVAGAREDWDRLPHKMSPALSRYGRSRAGPARHSVTIFWGPGAQKISGRRKGE